MAMHTLPKSHLLYQKFEIREGTHTLENAHALYFIGDAKNSDRHIWESSHALSENQEGDTLSSTMSTRLRRITLSASVLRPTIAICLYA